MDKACTDKKAGCKKTRWVETFPALQHRNFRLFWCGQCISLIGTWMQNVAQAWLVLEITQSAFWLGVVSAVQFLPILVFSLYAGTLIDRIPKQKVLLFTQSGMLVLAFLLGIDTWLHTVALWHVLIIAGLLGTMNTLDMPTRQAFVIELVGPKDLMNAIALNSTIFNVARIAGPSVAGFIIARLGTDACFLLNAASFLPVIIGIAMIRPDDNPPDATCEKPERKNVWQEITAGLSYVFYTPTILLPMLLLAVINIFTINFNVLVPLYAKTVFGGGAQQFGFLMSAIGLGAVFGSVVLAAKSAGGPKFRVLILAALGICLGELLLVPTKSYIVACFLFGLVGIFMITFTATTNSLIQVQTPHHLRGRIMSIYSLVFAGLSPVGSFLSGTSAQLWGAAKTFGLGAAVSLSFVLALILRYPSLSQDTSG